MPDKETITALANAYGVKAGDVSSGGGDYLIFNYFLGVIFGIIGFYAFNNGRKEKNYRHLILGIGLMAYPYFILNNTLLIVVIGVGLTAAIFLWKE